MLISEDDRDRQVFGKISNLSYKISAAEINNATAFRVT